MNNKMIGITAAVILLVAGTAAVASYATRESIAPQQPVAVANPSAPVVHRQQVVYAQPQQPRCDDKNIVGTLAGGVAGGLVGSQIGHGNGKTVAMLGGAAGGALLGNQYIPTRNVTCRQ